MWLDQWLVKQIARAFHWRYSPVLGDESRKWGRDYEITRVQALIDSLGAHGEDIVIRKGVQILAPEHVTLGHHVAIGYHSVLQGHGGITLGNFVLLGDHNILATSSHPVEQVRFHTTWTKPIHIKENAWLGANVTVLPGITIGENAAIGAGSVVTEDIPDNTVAVGAPAKVIRTLDFPPETTLAQKRAIRAGRLRKTGSHTPIDAIFEGLEQ